MKTEIKIIQNDFNRICDLIFAQLRSSEVVTINLHAEKSNFVRFNQSKVRQTTSVLQKQMTMTFLSLGRTLEFRWPMTGQFEEDRKNALVKIGQARRDCEMIDTDDHQVMPRNNGHSEKNYPGLMPPTEELIETICSSTSSLDLAGLLCQGFVIAANRNSLGQSHWFSTDSFFIDYSLYDGSLAVKGNYSANQWDESIWLTKLEHSRQLLKQMHKPILEIKPGNYRVYLAPGAVSEITTHLSWGALSQSAYKRGLSAFKKLGSGDCELSPLFSIRENFDLGLVPSFNGFGELSDIQVPIVHQGQLKQFLTNTRSANEFNLKSNFANDSEGLRSPEILPGKLTDKDILKNLDTGLYLSNLHYINWSDRASARITGMTRYACFWVEKGEIVGPIRDLRFDVSLYDILGKDLEAVTEFQEIDPVVDTYTIRNLGGKKIPGFMINSFRFTL